MEKSPYISYPGNIATVLNDAILFNPDCSAAATLLLSVLFTFFLVFIVYKNFADANFIKPGFKKTISSPALFIIVAAIGIFLFRLSTLVSGEQNMDESQWIVNAASWLNGAIIWKEVSGFSGGPLVFIPLSVMYYLGDGLNYASIRLFGILLYVIPSFVFVFLTLKSLVGKNVASLLSIPLILFFCFAYSPDFIAYNSEWLLMLLISVSAYLFFSSKNKLSNNKLLILALILGCFPYAKLQAVPIAFAISFCAILEFIYFSNKSNRYKFIFATKFISFALLPSLCLLIYLYSNGIFLDFYSDYILQNLNYANSGLAYQVQGVHKFLIPVHLIFESADALLFFVSIPVFSFAIYFFRKSNSPLISLNRNSLYLFLIFLSAYFSASVPGLFFTHYLNLIVIPFLLFIACLFSSSSVVAISSFPTRLKNIIILFLISITSFFYSFFGTKKDFGNTDNFQLGKLATEIKKYSTPNDKLSVWGWNHKIYVETGLTQATKHANTYYEVQEALIGNTQLLNLYLAELYKNKPTIIVDASKPHFFGFEKQTGLSIENFLSLHQFVLNHYKLVSTINEKNIYVLKEKLSVLPNF